MGYARTIVFSMLLDVGYCVEVIVAVNHITAHTEQSGM